MADHLTRRGWDAETRRHRDNLTRALDSVRQATDRLSNRLHSGEDQLAGEARQLVVDALDVAQSAAALEAAGQLSFVLEEN